MESWTDLQNELEHKRATYKLSRYDEKLALFIEHLIIPNEINFEVFNKNLSIVEKLPIISNVIELGSKSLKRIANENVFIPKGYENFFIAAFPDVYLWVHENLETDKDLINLFDHFELHRNSITDERDKFSIAFCKKICEVFLKKGFTLEVISS